MIFLQSTLAVFLALVLGLSASMKVLQSERFRVAISKLTNVDGAGADILRWGAAFSEALIAISLILPMTARFGAVAAFFLFLSYAVTLLLAVSRGENFFDCGCSLVERSMPIKGWTLFRPFLLTGLSSLLVLFGDQPPALSVSAMIAGLAFIALYLAFNEVDGLKVYRSAEQ